MLVGDCLENLLVRGLNRHVGSAGSAPRYQAAALGDTQAVHLRDHANTSLGTGPISRPLGSTEGTAQTLPSDSRDLGPSTFGPYLLVHFLKANVRILRHRSVAYPLQTPASPLQEAQVSDPGVSLWQVWRPLRTCSRREVLQSPHQVHCNNQDCNKDLVS